MSGKNNTRWIFLLALAVLGLRFGYKYYRSQQKPDYQVHMENAEAKQQALIDRIQADQDAQRAGGAVAVVADSAVVAADSTRSAQ